MDVFVFPVEEMVFFPTSAHPLYIFEPRYLRMIQDSLDSGTPIALTHLDPVDPGVRARGSLVAGVGEPLIYESRPDNTLVVVMRGLARVRVEQVRRAKPYIVCDAEVLPELNEVLPENRFDLARLRKILVTWMERALPEREYRMAVEEQLADPQILVETYATHQVHDIDLKQALLEQSDINDRIRILSAYEAEVKASRAEPA